MAPLDTRSPRGAGAGGDRQQRQVVPLYKRLPPGPHRLDRDQVLRHQRLRIHGAMVEAVAADGYEATSVKQLIALAGVSRRSFYEQFANKEECFLATFDLLARRMVTIVAASCDPARASLEERLRPPLQALARHAVEDPKTAGLLIGATPRLGAPGLRRLCQASAACERLLGAAFAESAGTDALPPAVLRGLAGGLQAAIATAARRERDPALLAESMLQWACAFAVPSADAFAPRAAAARSHRRPRAATRADGTQRPARAADPEARGLRGRLLASSLRLAAEERCADLTLPQIADHAGVPMESGLALFASASDCAAAAVAEVGDDLLARLAGCRAEGRDWPRGVSDGLATLLRELAESPLHARALVELAFLAGDACASANLDRIRALAEALTAGAPRPRPSPWTVELIAGALLHALRCQVVLGRTRVLPLLADQLAFVVLAPCLGGERAAAEIAALSQPRLA